MPCSLDTNFLLLNISNLTVAHWLRIQWANQHIVKIVSGMPTTTLAVATLQRIKLSPGEYNWNFYLLLFCLMDKTLTLLIKLPL